MRIGEVAAEAGVSTRMLRYYEEQQLLESTRTPGGQRQYADGTVERVRLIHQFHAAGLPSRAIRKVLPCADARKATAELLDLLAAERDRIDRQMTDLQGVRDRLDDMITEAAQPGHTYCPYLSA
ncbi:MerR family transcriptional regulator [Streptomyces sp. NBC_00365]|uniref:MerR family transcriptional regulator n=1 Tax=Streptomyces sp. NBC_00365 TaxID=2975726 RepID=UPI0022580F3E|nr:MerR family transcriptional regulator [Streptomyces sp. NBC_00365]MCX5095879.1 MerR family transcriptional regulator [Streptomyces sp. NBC_00365]